MAGQKIVAVCVCILPHYFNFYDFEQGTKQVQ